MLTRSADRVPDDETLLVQEYMAKPFLLDGFKFDLRLYVLVTSFDPLRVFLYRDGLVRLSTQEYKAPCDGNLDDLFMHLTNYSINKHADNFEASDAADAGSKRSLAWLTEWLDANGHDSALLWRRMADVVLKTLMIALPANVHAYKVAQSSTSSAGLSTESKCFAIFGFDLFLDRKLKPFVIEVNRSPSFTCDSELDHEIKFGVVCSALRLLKLRPSQRTKTLQRTRQEAQARLLGTGKGRRRSSAMESTAAEAEAEAAAAREVRVPPPNNKKPPAADPPRAQSAAAKAAALDAATAALDAFEDKVCGEYWRVYPPPPEMAERADAYRYIIEESTKSFFGQGGTRGPAPRRPSASGTGEGPSTPGRPRRLPPTSAGSRSGSARSTVSLPPQPKVLPPVGSGPPAAANLGERAQAVADAVATAMAERDRLSTPAASAEFKLLEELEAMQISCPGPMCAGPGPRLRTDRFCRALRGGDGGAEGAAVVGDGRRAAVQGRGLLVRGARPAEANESDGDCAVQHRRGDSQGVGGRPVAGADCAVYRAGAGAAGGVERRGAVGVL